MSGFRHFISDPELAAQPQRGALALSALENDDAFADLISGVTYGTQPLVAIGSDNNRPGTVRLQSDHVRIRRSGQRAWCSRSDITHANGLRSRDTDRQLRGGDARRNGQPRRERSELT